MEGAREADDAEREQAEGDDDEEEEEDEVKGQRYGSLSDGRYEAGVDEDEGGSSEEGGGGEYDSRDAGGEEDSLPDQVGKVVAGTVVSSTAPRCVILMSYSVVDTL